MNTVLEFGVVMATPTPTEGNCGVYTIGVGLGLLTRGAYDLDEIQRLRELFCARAEGQFREVCTTIKNRVVQTLHTLVVGEDHGAPIDLDSLVWDDLPELLKHFMECGVHLDMHLLYLMVRSFERTAVFWSLDRQGRARVCEEVQLYRIDTRHWSSCVHILNVPTNGNWTKDSVSWAPGAAANHWVLLEPDERARVTNCPLRAQILLSTRLLWDAG